MTSAVLITPKGGVDWDWFNWHRRVRETRGEEGLCVDCGRVPSEGNTVVCGKCRGSSGGVRMEVCGWCGGKRKLNAGMGGPTYPVWLRQCEKPQCRNAPIPDTLPAGVGAIRVEDAFSYRVELNGRDFWITLTGRANHWTSRDSRSGASHALGPLCDTPWAALQSLAEALQSQDAASPSIEDLTDRLADAIVLYRKHGLERIRAALEGGAALTDLKGALLHGDFGPHVERLGLGERTARRWMQLHNSGLSAEDVQAIGGIKKTVQYHLADRDRERWERTEWPETPEPSEAPDAHEPPPKTDTVAVLPDPDPETAPAEPGDAEGEAWARFYDGTGPKPGRPESTAGLRECLTCRNTPRRGSEFCRPCEYACAADFGQESVMVETLIRENHRLRKSVKGLKFMLFGNTRAPTGAQAASRPLPKATWE